MHNLRTLRDGCLLHYDALSRTFRFSHLSLAIYFLSKELFESAELVYQNYVQNAPEAETELSKSVSSTLLLHSNLNYGHHGGIIRELGARVRLSIAFSKLLLDIIQKSRELPGLSKLAANAATVLNAGGHNLSRLPWQNVQIQGAVLDFAILAHTNLCGANLRGVSLQQAWLPEARLNGANLEHVQFGEMSALEASHGNSDKSQNLVRSVRDRKSVV